MKPKSYWKKIADRESKRAKRGWAKRHAAMQKGPVDADTLRWRALQDRKGNLAYIFESWDYKTSFYVFHARIRTDSFEVYQGGAVVCLGGRYEVGRFLAKLLP